MAFSASETFDGASVGTTIDSTNTIFDLNVVGAPTFVAGGEVNGQRAECDLTASGTLRLQTTFSPDTNGTWFTRHYAYWSADPSATTAIAGWRSTANTVLAQIQIVPGAGTFRIRDKFTAVDTSVVPFPTGQFVRIEWDIDAIGGTMTARFYWGANLHGATADVTLTGAYTQTNDAGKFELGSISNVSGVTLGIDEVALSDTAQPGPLAIAPEATGTISASATSSSVVGGIATDPSGIAFRESFEGTPGATITGANSVFELTKGTGSATFESSPAPIVGSTLGLWDPLTDSVRLKHEFASADVPITYTRLYIRPVSLPPTFERFLSLETSEAPGTTPPGEDLGGIGVRPDGKIRVRGGGGYELANETSGAWAVPGEWIRVELKHDQLASVATLRIFAGANLHGTIADEEVATTSVTYSALGFPLVGFNLLAFTGWSFYVDEAVVGISDWIGPAEVKSGTISASATSSATVTGAAAAPVASGTISASATSSSAVTGAKTVSGTAAASATSSSALAGSKSVSSAISASATSSSALTSAKSGSGTASASATSSSALSGAPAAPIISGTISASATSSASVTGSKSVSGSVSATGASSEALSGSKTGSGTLTSSATSGASETGSRAGIGTISASATSSSSLTGNAAGNGSGTISASATSSASVTGSGSRSGSAAASASSSEALSGSAVKGGTAAASATSSASVTGNAAGTGSGTISASAASSEALSGSKSAIGSGSATATSGASVTGSRAATGTVSASAISQETSSGTKAALAALAASAVSSVYTLGYRISEGTISASAASSASVIGVNSTAFGLAVERPSSRVLTSVGSARVAGDPYEVRSLSPISGARARGRASLDTLSPEGDLRPPRRAGS